MTILLSYELDLVDIDFQYPGRVAKTFKYLPRLIEKNTLTGNGILSARLNPTPATINIYVCAIGYSENLTCLPDPKKTC